MSNASEYADSLTANIQRMTEAGAPYGITDDIGNNWTDEAEDLTDFQDNPDTEWQVASATDYLSDVLDIQYLVNSDRSYRAARICITLGGPTAWIDTDTNQLRVAWWSAPEYRELPKAFIDGLDEALSELWEMGA